MSDDLTPAEWIGLILAVLLFWPVLLYRLWSKA
jgi:hypothetical protein